MEKSSSSEELHTLSTQQRHLVIDLTSLKVAHSPRTETRHQNNTKHLQSPTQCTVSSFRDRSSPSRFGTKCSTPRIRFSNCTKPANIDDRVTVTLTDSPTVVKKTETLYTHTQNQNHTPSTATTTTDTTTADTALANSTDDITTASAITDILRPRWQNRSAGRRRDGQPGLLTSLLSKESSVLSDVRFATSEHDGTSNATVQGVQAAGMVVDSKLDDAALLMDVRAELSVAVVRLLGWSLSKLWRCLFTRVEIDQDSIDMLTRVLSKRKTSATPVVFLPSHRSHVDYLMLSYVLYGHNLSVPVIAAGDNLQQGAIGSILRSSGAFFIRRTWRKGNNSSSISSNNTADSSTAVASNENDNDNEDDYLAYRRTVRRYVGRLMLPPKFGGPGVPLEIFIEGGRTRDGVPLKPKLGLLSLLVENYITNMKKVPDVLLVPISMTYERVPEGQDMSQQRLGKPKVPESFWNIIMTGLKLFLLKPIIPKGRMHVRCGAPLSLKRLLEEGVRQDEEKLPADERRADGNTVAKLLPHNAPMVSVACSVQASIRMHSVIPLTAVVAASILARVDNGVLSSTPLCEVVEDVIDTLSLFGSVGGKIPPDALVGRNSFNDPCTKKQRAKMTRRVVRCLQVLHLNVTDAAEVTDMQMSSPTRRLELSSLRNQCTHLLSFVPYTDLLRQEDLLSTDSCVLLRNCLMKIVSHRYRLNYVEGRGKGRGKGRTMTTRQSKIISAAVCSAMDVYTRVGMHLCMSSSFTAEKIAPRAVALQVQNSIASTASCDSLALDTLSNAVKFYREMESTEKIMEYVEMSSRALELLRGDREHNQTDVMLMRSETKRDVPLWEL
jgi:1-acyl-sn-glycerol-3-phosphate acyltransferase